MPAKKLSVVLCWHMHQPDYRNLRTGEYRLPWTFLHVIKDYTDMAHHLENHPQARAVVNFAPVLLEQIEDYSQQVQGFLKQGSPVHDPLLAALVDATPPTEGTVRQGLIKACLRAQRERQINRHPAYRRLAELADWLQKHPDDVRYLSSQYLVDLIVWYHLAWLGESIQRNDSRAKRLIERGHGFTLEDRRKLLELIGEHLGTVVSRYRALAERGQIELSVTPYAHPILPLLLDLNSTLEALPDARMPLLERYPGGEARGRWHIEKGQETFERFFGFRPEGCWPAEGGVSTPALQLLGEAGGFRWAASGGNVLRASLAASQAPDQSSACAVFRPYRVTENPIACFFRDDGLSDLIGFKYADWHADDAVGDFIKHLENIAHACGREGDAIVPIVMDGENAWEHYPHNGYYFLDALYERLSNHPELELTTFSAYLDKHPDTRFLRRMVAGSWVYGTFSTWIGDTDKNRAWDLLGAAKRVFDRVAASGRLSAEQRREADMQLAVCEGSDWFWWFGDYNPEEIVSDFERQFRLNLANLYLLLGEEPPHTLAEVFSHGGGAPLKGGAMRPGNPEAGI
ncbi:MAG TPA: glycoside hydrolase family 57 protein [Methylococcaceae bacterium]|nr:glycoside hydrolase family 57 protein [Methylococcaceae bacterium]